MDSYYTDQRWQPNYDHTFYTGMLGEQDGKCEYVYVNPGERIEKLVIYHDKLIRVLEFTMSTGRTEKAGEWSGWLEDLDSQIIDLSKGQEIVGLYGKLEQTQRKNMSGSIVKRHNFVSLGIILNQCTKEQLLAFAEEASKKQ